MDAVIDLGESRPVSRVEVDCLRAQGPWIFLPQEVVVSVSPDGQRWTVAGSTPVPLSQDSGKAAERILVQVSEAGEASTARYVRVRAVNRGPLPDWHPGAPGSAWLFVDEILVEGASPPV